MERAVVYLFEVWLNEGGLAYKLGVSGDEKVRAAAFESEREYPFDPIDLVLKREFPSMSDAKSAEDRCMDVLRLLDCEKDLDGRNFYSGENELFHRRAGSVYVPDVVERCLEVETNHVERGWSSGQSESQPDGKTGNLFDFDDARENTPQGGENPG